MIPIPKSMDGIHLKEIESSKELHKQIFVEESKIFFSLKKCFNTFE
jgi:hypothetical protein